jgi:hypothetical protein
VYVVCRDQELAVMKLITFFIVLTFLPEFAMAQDLASQENTLSNMSGQAAVPQSSTDRSQLHGANGPNNSPIELNALYNSGAGFMSGPGLFSGTKQTDGSEHGVIDDWREQMFKTIRMYFSPFQEDPLRVNHLLTDDELDKQADEGRVVMKLVLKETLKFSEERVDEIDRLVKALKYEVSSDRTDSEDSGTEAGDIKTGVHKIADKKSGEAHPAVNAAVNNKVILKTGLRVRVDSGKLGVVSETEAKYGKASYFYKANLDNKGDNSLGFRYVLGRDIYIQVERDFNRTMDPAAQDKPSINLIQLGCRF